MRKSMNLSIFRSNVWWQRGIERARFESYLVISLALDSGIFCNVILLFCQQWLAFSVSYWNQSIFSYSSWHLPKVHEMQMDIQKNAFICSYVKWRCNTRNTRVFVDARTTRHCALEFCSEEASHMGREKKSPAFKCHIITGESKEWEAASSSSPF